MFIQFWLDANSTKSPGFARYPGGTPSCSSCSAAGSQSTAIRCASTRVPHRESGFLFPFAAFKFVIPTKGKSPVCFPHFTHLKGFGTDDYLINAFSGKMGISSEGGTQFLGNAIWNQCILQICSNNATSIKNKQPHKFVYVSESARWIWWKSLRTFQSSAAGKFTSWYFNSQQI